MPSYSDTFSPHSTRFLKQTLLPDCVAPLPTQKHTFFPSLAVGVAVEIYPSGIFPWRTVHVSSVTSSPSLLSFSKVQYSPYCARNTFAAPFFPEKITRIPFSSPHEWVLPQTRFKKHLEDNNTFCIVSTVHVLLLQCDCLHTTFNTEAMLA